MLEKYSYKFPVINTNYDNNCTLSLRFRNLVFHNSGAQEVCSLRILLTHMFQLRKMSLYVLRNI